MAAGNRVPRDGQEALALMRGVLAREPRGGEVSELMAMTQAALGQCGEAVTWQREALAAAERLSRPDLPSPDRDARAIRAPPTVSDARARRGVDK